jgi:hypothetical protein
MRFFRVLHVVLCQKQPVFGFCAFFRPRRSESRAIKVSITLTGVLFEAAAAKGAGRLSASPGE